MRAEKECESIHDLVQLIQKLDYICRMFKSHLLQLTPDFSPSATATAIWH
jgi:hypothetical protein